MSDNPIPNSHFPTPLPTEEKNAAKTWSNLPAPLISFFLSFAIFILILVANGFISFSGGSMVLSDNFDQYFPFIYSFLNVLKGKQSFWYSFSLYAGSGSALTYLYYCFSPFNLLYLLPGLSIITCTHLIAALKTGLAAAAFTLYSEKTLEQKKAVAIFFAVCYALCSWAVIMSINCMWADSLYVMPVLIMLISKLIKKAEQKTFILLVLCYAYLFLTNFYMGYIIGFFSALYFICMAICNEASQEKGAKFSSRLKSLAKSTAIYIASVLTAAALGAAFLLPAGYFLLRHLRGATEPFAVLSASLPEIFSSLYACSNVGLYSATPYIYCGIPVLMLVPFYFASKNVSITKKISATIMLSLYFSATLLLPVYAFLHAFDNPNYYPFRFSPCIVFILVSLSERAWADNCHFTKKNVWIVSATLSMIYAFLVLFSSVTNYAAVTNDYFVLNTVFIFLWAAVGLKMSRKNSTVTQNRKLTAILPYAAFILLAAEFVISSSVSLQSFAGNSPDSSTRINATNFDAWYSAEKKASDEINATDSSFYRVRVNNEKSFNGASLFGINTLTSFASYEESAQRSAFSSLGVGNAYHMLYDISGLPLTDMLFDVKYQINIPSNNSASQDNALITQNSLVLPIAYTVSSDIASYQTGDNPFENMNELVHCMTGSEIQIFEKISPNYIRTDSFNTYVYSLGDMVAYDIMTDSVNKGFVTYAIPRDQNRVTYAYFKPSSGTYYDSPAPFIIRALPMGLECTATLSSGAVYEVNRIVEPEEFNNDSESFNRDNYTCLTLYINTEGYRSYSVDNIYFVYYDPNALTETYNQLKDGAMQVNSFRDDHIEGTVTATDDRPILFTSIPYDKGWQAFVDGAPAKIYVTTNDAFCALALSPGEHSIVFDYTAPLAFQGSIISALAILFLLIIYLGRNGKSKNKTMTNKANETDENETKTI